MAEEQINPFGGQPPPRPQWGGMPTITPQEGGQPNEGGSFFQISPEAMQMMWAPQGQQMPQQGLTSLVPQPQVPPPQINPLI